MPDTEFLLPSVYLNAINTVCTEKYIDLPRILAGQNISPSLISGPTEFISQIAFIEILNEAAKAGNDYLFGFLVGRLIKLQDNGVMGQFIAAQTCIGNMYPIINFMFNVENRGAKHELITQGNNAIHDVHYFVEDEVNCDQVAFLTVTAYFVTFGQLLGEEWQPTKVIYRQEKPSNIASMEDFYQCPVEFGADRNAIVFPASLIYQKTNNFIKTSREMKIELAKVLSNMDNLQALVASYIEYNLTDSNFDMGRVAKCLGVHTKVLQNCLADKGVNFREILENVRKQKASDLLLNTQLSVADIAEDIGYQSSRTFVRAFKSWTHTTPLKWRKARKK